MLNYLNGEWYKLMRRRGLYVLAALGLLAVLLWLLALRLTQSEYVENDWTFVENTVMLSVLFVVGAFLAPVVAAFVFGDQYGRGTLKNEIVFGVARPQIYLGKLLAAAGLGTVLALVFTLWYLLLNALLFGTQAIGEGLALTAYSFAMMLPKWLASLSVAMAMLFLMHSAGGAMALSLLGLMFGSALSTMRPELSGLLRPVVELLQRFYFMTPQTPVLSSGSGELLASWGVSLCWVAGASAAGLFAFRRKEIQ